MPRMNTLSKTRRASVIWTSLLVAAATSFGAVPAQAVPPGPPASSKITYVALGDSYAAGVGGGDYLDSCLTSPNGYAALLADDPGQVHTDLRGCAGATTTDVLNTQLAGIDSKTKTITLTVGANDLAVAELATICLTPDNEAACLAALADRSDDLVVLSANLVATLTAIRQSAPKATVSVIGYPLFFDNPTTTTQLAVNTGTLSLNAVIASAVATAGPGFVYVDVVPVFLGHGLDSAEPWIISPFDAGALPFEPFHPNPAGYVAYADAIRAP
jgi:lysophospholipase L1-like esterase